MTLPKLPQRPDDLPNFRNPPLDEVVIGLQFPNLANFEALVGEFRESVKDSYPGVQYQPRLPPTPPPNVQQLPIFVTPSPPLGQGGNRIWLISLDESKLIQLQSDRFVHNWRRRVDPYPSFEPIFTEFGNRYTEWRDILRDRDALEYLQPQQLELTYTNWFPNDHTSQSEVLTQVAVASAMRIPGAQATYEPLYSIGNYSLKQGGVPRGRLSVNFAGNSLRSIGVAIERGTVMNISFFSELQPGISDDQLTESIAFGRNAIVYAFDQLITDRGREVWGRK